MPRSTPSGSDPFPLRQVAAVPPRGPEQTWLVEPLWGLSSVGLVAACPKVGKTWLVIELAIAVASGGPALGRFAVRAPGPVLFFGAEDDPSSLRARFQAVADARGVDLAEQPLYLLDVAELRLDRDLDLARLRATLAACDPKPRLLVLDPFVRLAAIDENSAAEVSAVLGSLRALQRDFDLALIVVHHMRKASATYLGHQVRGSGDFAAWYDSALFLTRAREEVQLTVSHRGAPNPDPVRLRLAKEPTPHLSLLSPPSPSVESRGGEATVDPLQASILERLATTPVPLPTEALRQALRRRKADVIEALHALRDAELVINRGRGWSLRGDDEA